MVRADSDCWWKFGGNEQCKEGDRNVSFELVLFNLSRSLFRSLTEMPMCLCYELSCIRVHNAQYRWQLLIKWEKF